MVMLLAYAEELLDLGNVAHIGVVNLLWVQFLHLFFGDEATLVAESLLRQVLPAVIAHFLLGAA